ncbi:MAG: dTMP kinase [candidate division Zixibacteria bacterium]|nr:dTMP kinase [candidate division Zixibacteria bacterium]
MFITFEGIDSSGKSTQCQLLGQYLTDKGFDVLLLREPGGTKISEKIRDLLLDVNSGGMLPLAEFLLYSAARAQLVNEVIRPALTEGKIVICDRFDDSSTAYQGHARGLGMDNVKSINKIATGGLIPDLTIFIDITVEESLKRLKVAGKMTDRMESEDARFFEAVREGYLQLATDDKSDSPNRFKVINGLDDISTIERRIQQIVRDEMVID